MSCGVAKKNITHKTTFLTATLSLLSHLLRKWLIREGKRIIFYINSCFVYITWYWKKQKTSEIAVWRNGYTYLHAKTQIPIRYVHKLGELLFFEAGNIVLEAQNNLLDVQLLFLTVILAEINEIQMRNYRSYKWVTERYI